jgi:hypothetical protein
MDRPNFFYPHLFVVAESAALARTSEAEVHQASHSLANENLNRTAQQEKTSDERRRDGHQIRRNRDSTL